MMKWMSTLSSLEKPCSALVTIQLWQHHCPRCGHVWMSKIQVPKVCPACHDPRWNLPRKFWKRTKKKNHRFFGRRQDSDEPIRRIASHYLEARREEEEEKEERRREQIIRDIYRGQSKGMNPVTAIFNREEVSMTSSFRNRLQGASGP